VLCPPAPRGQCVCPTSKATGSRRNAVPWTRTVHEAAVLKIGVTTPLAKAGGFCRLAPTTAFRGSHGTTPTLVPEGSVQALEQDEALFKLQRSSSVERSTYHTRVRRGTARTFGCAGASRPPGTTSDWSSMTWQCIVGIPRGGLRPGNTSAPVSLQVRRLRRSAFLRHLKGIVPMRAI
jgi:hypothetical protein